MKNPEINGTELVKHPDAIKFVNHSAAVVIEMMKLVPSREEKFKLLADFLYNVNPEYAAALNKVCDTPEKRENIVNDVETKNFIPGASGSSIDPIRIVDFINNKGFVTALFGSPTALRKGFPK